jgi:hypothetical protein
VIFPPAAVLGAKARRPKADVDTGGLAARTCRRFPRPYRRQRRAGPKHYTDLLIRSLRDKSTALRDFLDLFKPPLGVAVPSRLGKKYRLPAT